MKKITGNIWDYHKTGHWIVITTNGSVKRNGEAVMGRGIALQAKIKFPDLPRQLGWAISQYSNIVHIFPEYRLITFPVKHKWFEKADLKLIEQSCQRLVELTRYTILANKQIYMVCPGCGNGGLNWKDVKPILERYLSDKFIIVDKAEGGLRE